MKKFLSLLLVLLMALSLAACGGNPTGGNSNPPSDPSTPAAQPSENPNKTGVEGISEDAVLRVAIDGEPDSLFAAYQQNKADNRVNSSMFNYLVEWDDEAKESKPSVATEWE